LPDCGSGSGTIHRANNTPAISPAPIRAKTGHELFARLLVWFSSEVHL
jgi:hypothetical protein